MYVPPFGHKQVGVGLVLSQQSLELELEKEFFTVCVPNMLHSWIGDFLLGSCLCLLIIGASPSHAKPNSLSSPDVYFLSQPVDFP